MGMYTEIYFRAELARDVPVEVVEILKSMSDFRNPEPEELPDHPLFQCSRWRNVGCGGSAYFPITKSEIYLDKYSAQWHVFFLANLKNYSGEIGHFFDWIDPYLDSREGEFLGYSLYEEDDNPILYHRQSEKNYFRLDKDLVAHWQAEAEKIGV